MRLRLRKAPAEAGDIVLLFADESEALTHPYLARAWAKRGADLRVPAPGQSKKIAMMGALDHAARRLIVHTSPTKRSADFIALLEELDRRYGPRPGSTMKPVVIVLDNGPIHTSKVTRAALAARAHWLTVEWLPKYAPAAVAADLDLDGRSRETGRRTAARRLSDLAGAERLQCLGAEQAPPAVDGHQVVGPGQHRRQRNEHDRGQGKPPPLPRAVIGHGFKGFEQRHRGLPWDGPSESCSRCHPMR